MHRERAAGEFRPGCRVSARDGVVLVAAAAASGAAFAAGEAWAEFGMVALAVTAHFFLFCNVFRIARALELTWAAVFLALAALISSARSFMSHAFSCAEALMKPLLRNGVLNPRSAQSCS